jgi:hypothetical protein
MRYSFLMPRKPTPPRDDPEQSKRFIDTAVEVGADTDDKALERAFKKISSSRSPSKGSDPSREEP